MDLQPLVKKAFRALAVSFVIASMAFFAAAQNAAQGKLRVYFVDVEGGQSTLFVTPEGHSPAHRYRVAGQQLSRCRPHCRSGKERRA
jgi:hypothetical protein